MIKSRCRRWLPLAVLVLAAPSVALGHGLLRSSSPSAKSVLTTPPREIRLTFTEAPERTFTRIRLIAATGAVTLGAVEIFPGNVAVAKIPGQIGSGEYRVEWQTAGSDGPP